MERCFFSQAAAAAYLKIHKRTFQRLLAGRLIPPADFALGGTKFKRQGWRASTLARILGECQRRKRYAPLSNKCVAENGHIDLEDGSLAKPKNVES